MDDNLNYKNEDNNVMFLVSLGEDLRPPPLDVNSGHSLSAVYSMSQILQQIDMYGMSSYKFAVPKILCYTPSMFVSHKTGVVYQTIEQFVIFIK